MCPVRRNVPSRPIERQTHDDMMSAVWRYGNVCLREENIRMVGSGRADDSFFSRCDDRRLGRQSGPDGGPQRAGRMPERKLAAGEQAAPEGSAACSRMLRRIPTSRRRGPSGPASGRQGAAGSRGEGHGQPREELVQTVLVFYGQRDVNGVRAEDGRAAYHAACRAYGAKG